MESLTEDLKIDRGISNWNGIIEFNRTLRIFKLRKPFLACIALKDVTTMTSYIRSHGSYGLPSLHPRSGRCYGRCHCSRTLVFSLLQPITFGMVLSAMCLNLRTRCRIHWLDESRFLLHVTDERMRVWRQKDTLYPQGTFSQLSPFLLAIVLTV
jgi:hypothetical protein